MSLHYGKIIHLLNFYYMPGYRNNHYVPQWYQKRFFIPDQSQNEFYYLDLKPEKFIDTRRKAHQQNPLRKRGTKSCFVEEDLYTIKLDALESTDLEQYFFGDIDHKGQLAVEYFANFAHPSVEGERFEDILRYMSIQKFRTPKGFKWLREQIPAASKNDLLIALQKLQGMHGAIWTECVWSIADASKSDTKFIISDHPVTVYNRACHPPSRWCRKANDPDIRLHGTHTIFPLSLDKALILTNLSWVRNPYQSAITYRPNPNFFRGSVFKFTDIQTLRYLEESEVLEINYIIKRRAWRYLAAAKEEWLYPENRMPKKSWGKFGHGYLLMPDPRSITFGGELMIGYHDGSATGIDEYGRRPWQKGFADKATHNREWETFLRFQGEYARIFGPVRKGRSFDFLQLSPERDDDDFHKYHLGLDVKK